MQQILSIGSRYAPSYQQPTGRMIEDFDSRMPAFRHRSALWHHLCARPCGTWVTFAADRWREGGFER